MQERNSALECSLPVLQSKHILLGHGSGGKLMHDLIEKVFRSLLLPSRQKVLDDSFAFSVNGARLAITTDSFVVDPIFFPGGNIGKLAVNGTINDLAVSGAKPLLLSAAFVLEEGFPVEDLCRIVASMKQGCDQAGVNIVTGDTKVVNRGKCDKVFITTTGIGIIEPLVEISANRAQLGDQVILNGDIAAHGVAIMCAREELAFDVPIESDTTPLNSLVQSMLDASPHIHSMRDLTRGGLASALNEIAAGSRMGIRIYEERIPRRDEVTGACELLGLDPLQVANEGKMVAIVAREEAEKVLQNMRQHPFGREAAIIGEVVADHPSMVIMKTQVGGFRVVEMLTGEQLPRIC